MTQVVVTLRKLEASVGNAFTALSTRFSEHPGFRGPNGSGGFFFVAPTDDGALPLLVVPVGEIDGNQIGSSATWAQTLAGRLTLRYPREFAVQGEEEHGNALCVFPYILAFSGLSATTAAALLMRTALDAGIIEKPEARERLEAFLSGRRDAGTDVWTII